VPLQWELRAALLNCAGFDLRRGQPASAVQFQTLHRRFGRSARLRVVLPVNCATCRFSMRVSLEVSNGDFDTLDFDDVKSVDIRLSLTW